MSRWGYRAWHEGRMVYFGIFGLDTDYVIEEGVSIEEDPLMQGTGLKDRDGKDIYEGDIIEHEDWKTLDTLRHVVAWSDRSGWWAVVDGDGTFVDGLNRCEAPRIVGNAHQNPEML